MTTVNFHDILHQDVLKKLFPSDRTDQFFEAFYGDAAEGAYNIELAYRGHSQGELQLEFQLRLRPGKCLACNLTYGLPQVFLRHPIININGLVEQIDNLLDGQAKCTSWELGATRDVSSELHVIPVTLFFDS